MIREPEQQATWLLTHYWDDFNFSDTSYIHFPNILEQAFVDYIITLPYVKQKERDQSVKNTLTKAEKEETGRMYEYFLELFDKYLYDPNSPYRSDESYLPVVAYILADQRTDPLEKTRSEYRLGMIMKNRLGEVASDFVYTLPSKKTGRLYGIKTDYTILTFYNPDCNACAQIMEEMKASPLINMMLNNKTLSILAFYPDEDTKIWEKHIPDIPKNWINAYDKGTTIKKDELYDLKAIPTLYLLDQDKKVLLKDADFPVVENWLQQMPPR